MQKKTRSAILTVSLNGVNFHKDVLTVFSEKVLQDDHECVEIQCADVNNATLLLTKSFFDDIRKPSSSTTFLEQQNLEPVQINSLAKFAFRYDIAVILQQCDQKLGDKTTNFPVWWLKTWLAEASVSKLSKF